MERKTPSTAVFRTVLVLILVSLACSNPVQNYFSARESERETATAQIFTPTGTSTGTRRPTRTRTPSATASPTRTITKTPRPSNTPLPVGTLAVGSETTPVPSQRAWTQTGLRPASPNRFIENAAITKFSYIPPVGWKKITSTGSSLTSWEGPVQPGGNACMLVFTVEPSKLSSAEVAKELAGKLSSGGSVRILSQGKFINDAGLDAYKLVLVISSQGQNIQVVLYFFQSRGFLIESGFLRVLELNKEQDLIVDQSLKTLQYE